ncbi:neuropeptides capa receptor-like [Harmonia axyridis]|uniref:neuropeptides capa receptor-like n=1 Tax=Harmonia axyridis TaxID=115357 RepID=UPI001E2767BD|nr:neuropeptides capa receptor-like [Harmonia axyridis]
MDKMNSSDNFSDLADEDYTNGVEACYPYGYYIHLLHTYYLPSISIIGIVGNCLSFSVFMSSHMKMKSSSYYLAVLALADLGFLIVVIVVQCSFNGIFEIYNVEGWCQFFVYMSSVCATLSVWLIVAFTVERFIAVQYPFQKPNICTVRRARITVSILILLAIISQLYTFWIAGIIENDFNEFECEMLPQYQEVMKIVNFIDTIVTLILPLVMIVAMNTMIARSLIMFRKRMVAKEVNGRYSDEDDSRHNPFTESKPNRAIFKVKSSSSVLLKSKKSSSTHLSLGERISQIHIRNSDSSWSSKSQDNITKTLLIISSVFVGLNLPSYTIRIWIFFGFTLYEKLPPEVLWCTQQVAMLLYYTNFSVNFILYTMCGATFRRCLWKMIKWN